jgi:hypothetical protein
MKKQLLKLITSAVLLALFDVTFATHVLPIRTLVVPMAYDAIDIDGAADEAFWSSWQTTDAFNKTGCTSYPDADFTFTFKVCYDADYFYVFGTFLDDIDNSTPDNGATNPWTFDNAEIFIDLDTNGSGIITAYDSNTIQLRINRGMDSVQTPGRAPRSAYKLYWENTSDGWLFEVAVPWKAVLATSEETADIMPFFSGVNGFDMGGADSDAASGTPDLRDCQTAWDNDDPSDAADRTEDNAWNNRSVFGTFTSSIICITDCDDPCIMNPLNCGISVSETNNNESRVFPNPANNLLSISQIEIGSTISITNLLGQQLIYDVATTEIMNVDISSLPASNLYLVRITDKDGNTSASKFTKK